MKQISIIIIGGLLSFAVSAQSLSPQVMATSGDYYKKPNASLSFTLGETSTETYSAGGNTLTQGFQQPIGVSVKGLDIRVFLEGPYSDFQMSTELNLKNQIPNDQPYNLPPWNYDGDENANPIPNADVVDWVLIELRDADSAGSAIPETMIDRKAAFLLNDGSVVGVDGSSILQFNHTLKHKLFIVVWHRNHLGIISANSVAKTGGIHSYDFSTSISKVNNGDEGYKEVLAGSGVYGMVGGDANADGKIDDVDKTLWANDAGKKGYKSTDFNLDEQVNNQAKNNTWVYNGPYSSQIPSISCGSTVVDSRDGQSYNTVLIGAQCWMAENLNIGSMIPVNTAQTDNGTIEKYCYNNDTDNCNAYGGLYQWNEAMGFITAPGTQGICPEGWHLPANDELGSLLAFLGDDPGGKMKEAGTEHWLAPNAGATNESGFTALPGGFAQPSGNSFSIGARAAFWSSTEKSPYSPFAWYTYLVNYNATAYNFNNSKTYSFSIRCLKD